MIEARVCKGSALWVLLGILYFLHMHMYNTRAPKSDIFSVAICYFLVCFA